MLLLAIPFGLVIGLIVGTVGGGGAILALPVLVYILGEGVGPASTASLIVIALAAAVGAGALAAMGRSAGASRCSSRCPPRSDRSSAPWPTLPSAGAC